MTALRLGVAVAAALALLGGCTSPKPSDSNDNAPKPGPAHPPGEVAVPDRGLPGMPPLLDPKDIYAADRPNALSAVVRDHKHLVYVPNLLSDTVSIIDPATYKVVRTVKSSGGPQHVVPSWDLKTLWVNNHTGNNLIPIDPVTGEFGQAVPVVDPYNLYFTPDGKHAMVMAEAMRQILFRDPQTMAPQSTLNVPCEGVNHADFSADGRYAIATCEFSGELLKIDVQHRKLVGTLKLPAAHPMPQDVKISPDGGTWYVADMHTSGVWKIDGDQFKVRSFLPTGAGTHGLYVSRDSKLLYISNRGEGSVSLLDFATEKLTGKWRIPGGGSPDMGGLSPDGKVLWLSGRYNGEVYAMDTTNGRLLARIKVGSEPHGLCVWPQPGRYSLGHTGILR
ncbi:YncE family protein [Rhizomonospora bruguierae]|uniref:YncE family protein n=1 Tax=Rhizomonospora bruguierae TaxID=1581705 RepID=UPI0020BE3626|nr:beta-propeller fold lactonase family protein [Micromonospora sp. NBRC 107566]